MWNMMNADPWTAYEMESNRDRCSLTLRCTHSGRHRCGGSHLTLYSVDQTTPTQEHCSCNQYVAFEFQDTDRGKFRTVCATKTTNHSFLSFQFSPTPPIFGTDFIILYRMKLNSIIAGRTTWSHRTISMCCNLFRIVFHSQAITRQTSLESIRLLFNFKVLHFMLFLPRIRRSNHGGCPE